MLDEAEGLTARPAGNRCEACLTRLRTLGLERADDAELPETFETLQRLDEEWAIDSLPDGLREVFVFETSRG